jgi:MFS family permease
VGSVWLLSIPSAQRQAYLHGGVLVVMLAMGSLAAARSVPWAIGSVISLTLGTSTLFGLANTILQERAPDHLRGRVSAIAGMSFFGVLPFAGLAVARLVDVIGMRPAMAGSALSFGLAATLLLLRYGRSTESLASGAEVRT